MKALLPSQADVLGDVEDPFQVHDHSAIRVKVICPRDECKRPVAFVRDLTLADDHGNLWHQVVVSADRRVGAVLIVRIYNQAIADLNPGHADTYDGRWLLVEWPAVPTEVPSYCFECRTDRMIRVSDVRAAAEMARRKDRQQTIRAYRFHER